MRNATLPKWLAWVSVVLGVSAVAGPLGAVAFLIAPVWRLAVGVVLSRSVPSDERSVSEAVATDYQAAHS